MTSPVNTTKAAPKAGNKVNGVLPKPTPDVEVGVSAYLPFVVPYQNAWEALRTDEVTVKQLQAMRRTDGQARALYRLITLPIRSALKTATFVPEDNVEGGEDEATFIQQMFTLPASGGGMTVPFNKVIAQLAAQRAAVGTRIGKLPANPNREEKAAFQKGLADLGAFQWMTVPSDYEVESLREATGFDFLALVNHHNSQMSKSVLAAFFDKEQGGGDSGKLVDFGQQSDALFLLMLATIMGEIEEVIN